MGVMPIDILNKEFKKGFRGYDENEVNEFLDEVIKEFEKLLKEKKEMDTELQHLKDRVAYFTSIEETLKQSLIIAQETAERVVKDAEKHAVNTVNEGQKEANRMIDVANEHTRKAEAEVIALQGIYD